MLGSIVDTDGFIVYFINIVFSIFWIGIFLKLCVDYQ